ncbi:MAG TPA: nucleoside hydrolase [Clostridiaceae bacterium]|jgi:purine nucleosidase|nr:nucleoside hydrolase [Clostridiaceae bacterium]
MKDTEIIFPHIDEAERIRRLEPPKGKINMVLDTDTYNEVDDQFALAYTLCSSEKINLEAVYAAPFYNDRSSSPAEGMEKSYNEILNVFSLLGKSSDGMVYRGSTEFMKNPYTPCRSEAAQNLVQRVRAMKDDDEPLYVVAIGAITNVASAILLDPEIIRKIVVIWLGGHAYFWPHTKEFNLWEDIYAANVVFGCGVPLVQIPCMGVTSHLRTTIPELEFYLKGKSEVGTYLTRIVTNYTKSPYGWSKPIWDVAAIAWLVNSDWVHTGYVHSPIVTVEGTYSFSTKRHLIRCAWYLDRDPIFADMFRKLSCINV